MSARPFPSFLRYSLRYDVDMQLQIITIDGPAASGKSSVARGVADTLGIPFVSSGLLYRAATYLALYEGADLADEQGVLELLSQHTVVLQAIAIEPNRVLIDGQDESAALHTDDVDLKVSVIAGHPQVRDWVDDRLRDISGTFVIEGRDMGKKVFPQALCKFYLTASPEVRAQRRVGERAASLSEVTDALRHRDQLDARQLEPAADALHIDTSQLSLSEVIQRVLNTVKARLTLL